jgi:hypothetical protein
MISGPSTRSTSTCPRVGWPGSSVRTVRFNKGTIRMLFVTEPNRLKVLAGKILALTTSIAIRKRLINHAPAEEHLFGAPVEDRLWDGCQPSPRRRVVNPSRRRSLICRAADPTCADP